MVSVSLWTPLAYVLVLLTALVVFSSIYRGRKRDRLAQISQFYPRNYAQEIYQDLKSQQKVPQKLRNCALVAWAAEDITRMIRMREMEPHVASLHQQGIVGDQFHEIFTGSRKITEQELPEVAAEAAQVDPQWSYVIQSAMDVAQQNAVRRRMNQLDVFKEEYRQMVGRVPPTNPEKVKILTEKENKK